MGQRIILQDLPANDAAMGFKDYAGTFAEIIQDSNPRFAIGIFGGWGSGKTTLMNAIAQKLTSPAVVKVEFSAWRYEREPNLIVPLLDVIREALKKWADSHHNATKPVTDTLNILGRAVKALLAGFAFKAGVPNAMEVSFDASKALDNWKAPAAAAAEDEARSLYHACFTALASSFEAFAEDDPNRRIVVFVDDLDRCLPNNAIEVIEAMKLFFDLPGFVFVVGLDQKVVEAAVDTRYKDFNSGAPNEQTMVKGEDYIKKIFQVPFSVPPVHSVQLDALVGSYLTEANAPAAQQNEIRNVVLPHLRYVIEGVPINPRDIKRFINAFTISTAIKKDLNPNAVLAIQSMNFRVDWRLAYRGLVSFRALFLRALQDRLNGNLDALEDLDDEFAAMPSRFIDYVGQQGPGKALLTVGNNILEYIYAGEEMKSFGDHSLVNVVYDITLIAGRIKDLREEHLDNQDTGALNDIKRDLNKIDDHLMSRSLDPSTQTWAQGEVRAVIVQIDDILHEIGKGPNLNPIKHDWAPARARLKALVPRLLVNY